MVHREAEEGPGKIVAVTKPSSAFASELAVAAVVAYVQWIQMG